LPRSLKLLLWIGAFVVCAGIGAFIAASSNPFPPAVVGDAPSASGSVSPSAAPVQTWQLTIHSSSKHKLYVGGACRTRWKGTIELSVYEGGVVKGSGPVERVGRRRCTFPNAQIQLRTIGVSVAGTKTDKVFDVELRQESGTPQGSRDYGGFTGAVLSKTITLPARDGSHRMVVHRLDATGRGSYYATTTFTLRCTSGC
jgi:hypothetical protein